MLNQSKKVESFLFSLLILFLPIQLGKHFWPDFSIVLGLRVDYLSPTLYLTDIVVALLFICWCIGKIFFLQPTQRTTAKIKNVSFSSKFLNSSPLSILSLLMIFLTINIITSGNPLNGFYHLAKFFEFLFVGYYIATTIKGKRQLEKLFVLLSVGVLFSSLLALIQFINQGSLGGILYLFGERTFSSQTPGIANASLDGQLVLRPYATFSHPNVLAGYVLFILLPLLFFLPHTKKTVTKIFFINTILIGTAALLLSMSRVALVLWFGVLVGVFIYQGLHALRVKKNRVIYLTVIFFSIVILMFGLSASPLGSRLMQTSLTEESVTQRQHLIVTSLQMLYEKPLLGVGLGNFLPSLALLDQPLSLMQYFQPVHNIFLLVAVETGMVGLVLFISFLLMTYRNLVTSLQNQRHISFAFLVTLSALLVIGLFDHYLLTLQQGQLLFAVFLGLCWVRVKN